MDYKNLIDMITQFSVFKIEASASFFFLLFQVAKALQATCNHCLNFVLFVVMVSYNLCQLAQWILYMKKHKFITLISWGKSCGCKGDYAGVDHGGEKWSRHLDQVQEPYWAFWANHLHAWVHILDYGSGIWVRLGKVLGTQDHPACGPASIIYCQAIFN